MESYQINSCVCKVVRQAARSLTNLYDKALAPSGLRITQYGILSSLARHSSASVTQLAELLGLDQTTATRNLKVLEDSGWIERVVHHYPRVKLLRVTSRGKQRLQADEHWQRVQSEIQSALTPSELDELNRLLRKVDAFAVEQVTVQT